VDAALTLTTPTSTGGTSAAPAGALSPQATSNEVAIAATANKFKYLIRDMKHLFNKTQSAQ
jgi:hypothetical protein